MRIEQVKATDHIQEAWELLSLHREELATNKTTMILKPDVERYKSLEAKGELKTLVLYDDKDVIVGYSVIFFYKNLHYSDLLCAQNDLLYVHPDYRSSQWGLKLIRETERVAKAHGARMLLFHGKENTKFSALMPKLGYRVQDIMFSKEI